MDNYNTDENKFKKEIKKFEIEPAAFKELMMEYECAILEVKTKLDVLNNEFKTTSLRNPIENIKSRIKTPESLYEKLERKGMEKSIDAIRTQIYDVAGVRVICPFVDDIYNVADMLSVQDDITVISRKDYIKNPKKNGYRSLHLVVEIPIFLSTGKNNVFVEVQIRTIAMNFWATIEHSLQYKYKQNMPASLRARLLKAADAIGVLDSEMAEVREEIMDAQNMFTLRSNLVADILNNIQNLYKAANKREIIKIQDEFFKIYASEDLEHLERFAKELDTISEGYRAQSLR